MTIFDVPQMANICHVRPITIRRLLAAGKIPHHRIGRRFFFTAQDVEDFMAQTAVPARPRQAQDAQEVQ